MIMSLSEIASWGNQSGNTHLGTEVCSMVFINTQSNEPLQDILIKKSSISLAYFSVLNKTKNSSCFLPYEQCIMID